jgi:hypothetical protein
MSSIERAKSIQRLLEQGGHYTGKIDGILGPASRRAFDLAASAAQKERAAPAPIGFAAVGLMWTAKEFRKYLSQFPAPTWLKGVTMHHTGSPTLAMRPNGFSIQHIRNIQNFYSTQQKWNEGPHLFVDEDEIFGMTHVTKRGVHAASFNSTTIGIEVLGNYDTENPHEGRGLACWKMGAAAARAVLDWANIQPNAQTVLFHRQCRQTGKTCPGRKVLKDFVLDLIQEAGA